jgi:exodeoxyribonuclease V alpha subunit
MEVLSGSVVRVTYYNAENGYSVLRLEPEGETPNRDLEGLVTVTGNLPELAPGEFLQLRGDWTRHAKFGIQFQVEQLEQARPVTLEGIRRYLGSGLLKGIGPAYAERIVSHFGIETIEIIDKNPERLREVADIGPKRSQQILRALEEQKQIRDVMIFLHGHGVSTNLATKIYKQYGERSLHLVETDPYQLARDIYGVGFKTADRIAQTLGLPANHPSRLEAGLVYTLNEISTDGHVFAPKAELIQKANELLAVKGELIEEAIQGLAKQKQVVIETEVINEKGREQKDIRIYPEALHAAEVDVAERLRALADTKESSLADMGIYKHGLGLLALDQRLSSIQQESIVQAINNPVSVLTGGPGTGKTTTIKALIAALERDNKKYALASPTGRAAKRLAQASDRPASTIHRLLGFSPKEGSKFNEKNPLKVDLVVIDEASMLDLMLTHSLLKALKPGTHLLLVGDVDQLPSVGAGDILREVITSGVAAVTRLKTIYRQAEESHIISNAHLINQGELPLTSKASDDFFLFPAQDAKEAAKWVVDLVTDRIPKRFHLDPMKDIQVLGPLYRGPAGVSALNAELQQALNPSSPLKAERSFFGQLLRAGDRVMQMKNDYEKGVFNGDIGLITEISSEQQTLTVDFEGKQIPYDWNEADELTLAYAVTVHKSQGSEFPAIVMPVLTQHYVMLQRNLLYTGVTRAKQLCVLVGNKKAIAIAVKNNKVSQRWSGLAGRLKKAKAG